MSGNLNSQQQYVPWSVYLQDRREQAEANRRLENKVDRLAEKVEQLTIAVSVDDAAEIATEAAAEGVERARQTRSERLWDLGKTLFAAVVGGAVAITTAFLTGGWNP